MDELTRTSGFLMTYNQASELIAHHFNEKYGSSHSPEDIRFGLNDGNEAQMTIVHLDVEDLCEWGDCEGYLGDGEIIVSEGAIAELMTEVLKLKEKHPYWWIYTADKTIHLWWKGDGNEEEE